MRCKMKYPLMLSGLLIFGWATTSNATESNTLSVLTRYVIMTDSAI